MPITAGICLHISDEDIEEVFSEFPYELDAFYAIVDEGSNVQSIIDGTESTGYFEGSFWDNVRTYAENSSQLEVFNDGIMDNKYSSVNVNMNGERRIIYTSPIASKTWLLVMGIKAESIENKGSVLRRENDRYQVIMLVILAGMLGTIAVAAVLVGLRERKNKKELENKADTDLLTGISNKIATERQIKEYIAANPGSQAVMIVMDIDNFKKINDTMGHAFGDEVIKSVGHQLKSMFRITDVVGRLGGDEFIVLLKNIRDSKVIDKECRLLEECFHNFEVGEYVKYSVTASIGVAIFPRDADSFEKLYKAADSALYSAKRKGKNQLAFYNESKS
ncbi:MAG: GGDEF domain-containing protein [Lachnospiraceae bacterium]|nr:GGDEF domain-containing protein [Lachnospiraceae bacterium]